MLELSAPQQRYLIAACSASPMYAFRARVVGRLASFADSDTDIIVASLRHAGLIEMDSDRHARLTEQGRDVVRGLTVTPGPAAPERKFNTLTVAGAALAAVIVIVVAGLLLL